MHACSLRAPLNFKNKQPNESTVGALVSPTNSLNYNIYSFTFFDAVPMASTAAFLLAIAGNGLYTISVVARQLLLVCT